MKTRKYSIIILLIGLAFTACEKNDLIDDLARPGHIAHSVYWEVPTPNVVAGEDVSFKVQYWGVNDETKYLGVWYDIKRNLKYSLTHGGNFFTFSYDSIGSARDFQEIVTFEHNADSYDPEKKAYYFEGSFPTSYTLSSVTVKGDELYALPQTLADQLIPKYIQKMFYEKLYKELNYARLKKILVEDSKLITESDFLVNYADSTLIEDPEAETPKYDKFIKEGSKVDTLYYKVPFSTLVYDSPNQVYKFDYSSVYELGAKFKAVNGTNTANFSDVVKVELQ